MPLTRSFGLTILWCIILCGNADAEGNNPTKPSTCPYLSSSGLTSTEDPKLFNNVCVNGGTEQAWTGKNLKEEQDGVFKCSCCGSELYESSTKFDSKTGWPSFWDATDNVGFRMDHSGGGPPRIEAYCKVCGAHLGHVFMDGPAPTGERHCINSVCLDFEPTATASTPTTPAIGPSPYSTPSSSTSSSASFFTPSSSSAPMMPSSSSSSSSMMAPPQPSTSWSWLQPTPPPYATPPQPSTPWSPQPAPASYSPIPSYSSYSKPSSYPYSNPFASSYSSPFGTPTVGSQPSSYYRIPSSASQYYSTSASYPSAISSPSYQSAGSSYTNRFWG